MSAAMAAIRVLCCVVDGENEVFKVEVSTNDDVMDLKKRIHEEGIEMEYRVRSKRLTLWKVNTMSVSASILQLTTSLGSSTNP
jgi:Crinkler effector protein N-terminal domain